MRYIGGVRRVPTDYDNEFKDVDQDFQDEHLPTFFDALESTDQKAWLAQEKYDSKTLGINNLDDEQFKLLAD